MSFIKALIKTITTIITIQVLIIQIIIIYIVLLLKVNLDELKKYLDEKLQEYKDCLEVVDKT